MMTWLIEIVIVGCGIAVITIYFFGRRPTVPAIPASGRANWRDFPAGCFCEACGHAVPNGDPFYLLPSGVSASGMPTETVNCWLCAAMAVSA